MTFRDRVHPDLRVGLELIGAVPSPTTIEELDEFRALCGDLRVVPRAPDPSVVRTDLTVPGPRGAPPVAVRVLRPREAGGALPVLLWFHGGGMVGGSLVEDDELCEGIVREVGCAVVSVEYRLAPEHPHPAPVEDCYAALLGAVSLAPELGLDARRTAVGGAGAGGGLAAAVSLLARDRGRVDVMHQLLVSPMLDDRGRTPSSWEFSEVPSWSREQNCFGWRALLGDAAGSRAVDGYAAPARALDLVGLPPATVQVGDLEVFRDEAVDFAVRLMRARVPTELHVYPGAFHAWDRVSPDTEPSRRLVADRDDALRRALWT